MQLRTDQSARFLETLANLQDSCNPEANASPTSPHDTTTRSKNRRSVNGAPPVTSDPVSSYIAHARYAVASADAPPLGTVHMDVVRSVTPSYPATMSDDESPGGRSVSSTTIGMRDTIAPGQVLPSGGHRPQRQLHVSLYPHDGQPNQALSFFEAHRVYYSGPDGALPFQASDKGGPELMLVPPTRLVLGPDGSPMQASTKNNNSESDEDSDRLEEIVLNVHAGSPRGGGAAEVERRLLEDDASSLGATFRSTAVSRNTDDDEALGTTFNSLGQTVLRRRRAKAFSESIQEIAALTIPTKSEIREMSRTITGPRSGAPKGLITRAPPPPPPPSNYPYQLPQSLYGAYFEPIARMSIQQLATSLNAPSLALGLNGRGGKRGGSAAVKGPSSPDHMMMTGTGSPLNTNGAHNVTETRTFAELCELSRGTNRNWGMEWRAAQAFPVTSLSRLACKYRMLTALSEGFAAAASEIAFSIVSERNHVYSSRTHKHLEGFPHIYIVSGIIFVLAQTPSRNALFGSREAAGRAANLELLAQRAVLGAPHMAESIRGPLCCVVSVMGYKVFASAPMPIRSSADIVYGSLSAPGSHYTTTNYAQYAAYELAEYFGLEEHAVPTGSDADLDTTSHSLGNTLLPPVKRVTKIVLPGDAKIVYSPADGTNWLLDCARLMAPAASTLSTALNQKKDDPNGKTLARHPMENLYNAPLSVLFRPEFLRSCPYTPVNADGCLLSHFHNRGGRETVSYLIQILYINNIPAAMNELLALEHSTKGVWDLDQIGPILHRNGVNIRYLGRIYSALETTVVRHAEAREGLRTKLAYELAARTFKAVLAAQMSTELMYRGEGDRAVDMVRSLLLCNPDGAIHLWESQMRPTMLHKFGVYVCPVEPVLNETVGVQEVVVDRTAFKVYRALGYSGKRRVEKAEAPAQWKSAGAGFAQLDVEHLDREERENNTSSLYTLLGSNAEKYSILLHRVEDITGADLVADMRSKRVVCLYKPIVKSNTPMAISQSVAAVLTAEGDFAIQTVLANLIKEPEDLRGAVESCSRSEISAYERALESDPRVTLPIYMLMMCMRTQSANQNLLISVATKFVEVRKVVPSPIVPILSGLHQANMFAIIGRHDRCETALSDVLTGLAGFGNDTMSSVQCGQVHPVCLLSVLFTTAVTMANMWLSEFRCPPAEKAERILDYLHYASYLAEGSHHALLPYIMGRIASFRQAFSTLPMSTVGASEPDRMSSTIASTRRLGATARRKTVLGATTRRGVSQGTVDGDGDVEGAFERKHLPAIHGIMLPRDRNAVEPPCPELLIDVLTPSEFMHRIGGRGSIFEGPGGGLGDDLTKLYSRTVSLCSQLPGVRPAGSDVLGEAMIQLGTLQKSPEMVRKGISDRLTTFGVDAKPTIRAEIDLAEVLLARAEYHCQYTGANRDPSFLFEAEAELRATLSKVLAHPQSTGAYLPELRSLISSLHTVCNIYSKMPQAKREHEARHYLSEILPPVLGGNHALLRGVYDSVRVYYISMAGQRKELAARLNAVRTAAEYSQLWMECAIGCQDAEDDIASHLTIFTEEIAKPLRNGGATERNVSWNFFVHLSAVVADSSLYAKSTKIAAALASMEGVHKSQLKVVEQSERKALLIQEITQCSKDMHLAVRRVKRHKNRLDHFAAIQTKVVMDLGAKIKALVKGVRDETVLSRALNALEYHDEVLQVRNQQVLRQRQEADAALQAAMNLPPEQRDEALRAHRAAEEKKGDDEEVPEEGAEKPDGLMGGLLTKGYRSPYACLLPPDEQASDNRAATWVHLRDFAGAPGVPITTGGGKQTDPQGAQQRAPQRRTSSLGGIPGATAAANLSARMHLQDETASQAASLLPQVARSMAARNHNPIRSTKRR